MQNKMWIWIVALIVILGGAFFWYNSTKMVSVESGAESAVIDTETQTTTDGTPNETGSNTDVGQCRRTCHNHLY